MAALWPPREYCDLRSPRDHRCCIAMHRLLYNGISRKEGRRANTHHFPFFPPSPPFIPGGIPCLPCLLSGCQNAFLSSLIWKQESVCADVGGRRGGVAKCLSWLYMRGGGGRRGQICTWCVCSEPLIPQAEDERTDEQKKGHAPPLAAAAAAGGSDRDGRPTRLVCLPTRKAFVRRRWKKIRPPPPPFPPPFPLSPLLSDDKSLPSEKSTYVCTARAEGVVVWHLQRSSHDPTE